MTMTTERRWQPRDSAGHYLPYGAVPTSLEPDCWDDSCNHARPAEQRCEQCGRVGTRGFRTLAAKVPGAKPITVCANNAACRRRWPKRPADDE